MTQDHSGEDMDQTNTAEGNVGEAAPSASEEGQHGDTHDTHEAQGTHDAHDAHDAHDSHDEHGDHDDHGHGEDDSEKSTLVPVTWRQLIFPALILLIVAILLIGPISAAFAPRPAAPTNPVTTEPTTAPTTAPSGSQPNTPVAEKPPTATSAPVVVAAATPVPPTAAPSGISLEAAATRTAVAVLGEQGTVSRAPVQLQFAGAQFAVDAGSGTLPDWKPSGDATHATWIQGTFANHIIYLPYSDTNAALFAQAKAGDTVKLVMDSGQTFEFQVTRAERASNGPPTAEGQFTVTAAMSQDHAGVTVILVGDPATDRAVVQADFTGNIQ
jgi:hypothetical protein